MFQEAVFSQKLLVLFNHRVCYGFLDNMLREDRPDDVLAEEEQ